MRTLSNRQATTMKALPGLCGFLIKEEPMTGFEPVTSSLPRKCSTTELHWQICLKSTSVQPRSSQLRAEDEAQTRDPQLGRLMLYQLSYFRIRIVLWAKMDSNHRRYKPADLQSAPFGHSGIRPIG